mgnify:CR=1 FL=1
MKGFEMFTIGDCQSILLKMTSDNCTVSISFSIGNVHVVICTHRSNHTHSNSGES